MGRAHDTKRCAKGTSCCRSGKGRFAACSGWNSTGIFFSRHIYSSIQACVSTSGLYTTRHFSFFLETPRGAPSALIFFLKNAPGRYFVIVLWNAPGGDYSVLYGKYRVRTFMGIQSFHRSYLMRRGSKAKCEGITRPSPTHRGRLLRL